MSSKRVHAFTLIELLVVIMIIAVMASVVVPSYGRFLARSRFDGVVRDVQDIFAHAREQAVTNDTEVTVRYDPQSAMFVAIVTPPPPQRDQPVALSTGDPDTMNAGTAEAPRVVQLGAEYQVQSFSVSTQQSGSQGGGQPTSQNEVHFMGDGTVDGLSFALASSSGYAVQMTLWPGSGRLTMQDAAGGP